MIERLFKKENIFYWFFIIFLSTLFSFVHFSGVESHLAYSGSIFQAIHPGSFAKDEFLSSKRPISLSIFYLIAKFFGTIFLDDRFVILLYILTVLLAILGIHRIISALGIHDTYSILIITLVISTSHKFLDNTTTIIGGYAFKPTTLATAVAIWCSYFIITNKKLWITISCCILLVLISIKIAWLPVLICLVITTQSRRRRTKVIVITSIMSIFLVGLLVYYAVLQPKDGSDALVWETLKSRESGEANPFAWPNSQIGSIYFLAICIAAMFVKLPDRKIEKNVRLLLICGLAIWFLAGVFISYGPSFLHIPYVLPFAPTRALWLPQLIAYLTVTVGALQVMHRTGAWSPMVLVFVLAAAPFQGYLPSRLIVGVAAALFFLATMALLANPIYRPVYRPESLAKFLRDWQPSYVVVLLLSLALGMTEPLVEQCYKRRFALLTLYQTGIVGDNLTAKWAGVAEYLRDKTPPSAVVLAFRPCKLGWFRDDIEPVLNRCDLDSLVADGSLRTRAGRAMPVPIFYNKLFDHNAHQYLKDQWTILERLAHALSQEDVNEFTLNITKLGRIPDYLVAPKKYAQFLAKKTLLYAHEASIGNFAILQSQKNN